MSSTLAIETTANKKMGWMCVSQFVNRNQWNAGIFVVSCKNMTICKNKKYMTISKFDC